MMGDEAGQGIGAAAEQTWLRDVWSFYFHGAHDGDWTHASYVHLGDVSNVDEVWQMCTAIEPYLQSGMLFAMREGVFPSWDDPANIDGGCLSIKVPLADVASMWTDVVLRALGETLLRPAADPALGYNGVSISPKRGVCIVKVWFGSQLPDVGVVRLPAGYDGAVLFRSNRASIVDNQQAVASTAATR